MPGPKKDKTEDKNSLHRQLADIGGKLQQFWEAAYPAMTAEERKKYWISQLKPGVEWEKSQSGNALTLFEGKTILEWQEKEPFFLNILAAIGPEIGLTETEVRQIIQNAIL